MTIGLFAGMWTGAFLIVWSALGNWAHQGTPAWFLWLGVPILFGAGLLLSGLGRVARFFPVLWSSFSVVMAIACLVSAIVCFLNGQGGYGTSLLVWMVVLAGTFCLATYTGRER
jgi:hypothetical protein